MAKDKEINVEINDSAAPEPTEHPETENGTESGTPSTAAEGPSLEVLLAEAEDRRLRTMAEFDNYRKRTAQQFDQMVRSANEKLLLEMLEIVDNFERALQHSDEAGNGEALRKGTELIYNQMQAILRRYEVEAIEAIGQPFDPNLHDAMMQTTSEIYAEGLVALEIGKGYRIGDRVLRHAKVAVSTGPPQQDEQTPGADA
jgi:molecular chaperone GrpE